MRRFDHEYPELEPIYDENETIDLLSSMSLSSSITSSDRSAPQEMDPSVMLFDENRKEAKFRVMKPKNIRILGLFNRETRPPKKEYIRCQFIRGHKRAIRQISTGVLPKRTMHKFDHKDKRCMDLWNSMKACIEQDPRMIIDQAQTEAGPLTDGKNKRNSQSSSKKSYNFKFCQKYFELNAVRVTYYLYCELVFSDFTPKALCEKFKFNCCRDTGFHLQICYHKWEVFKRYVSSLMLLELEIQPYFPPGTIQNPITDQELDELEKISEENLGCMNFDPDHDIEQFLAGDI